MKVLGALVLFISWLPSLSFAQKTKILPPSPPPKVIPPHPTIEDIESDLKRKRMESQKYQPKKASSPEPSKLEVLQQQNIDFRDLHLHNQVGLFLPYVHTFGNLRKNYRIEPGLSYKIESKITASNSYTRSSIWLGIRLQSFNGSASYNNQNGRVNFFYFGPSFSYLWLIAKKVKKDQDSKEDTPSKKTLPKSLERNALVFSSGIALMNRYARVGEQEVGTGELEQVDLTLDGPGVWLEGHYVQIFASTISINYTAGLQTGESKIIFYFSTALGLWI